MIVAVIGNPAVDQTSRGERLEPGVVHRVLESNIAAAGAAAAMSAGAALGTRQDIAALRPHVRMEELS